MFSIRSCHLLNLSERTKTLRSFSVTPRLLKFQLTKRYSGSEPSVWVEYVKLATQYKPVNLGQGFTDYAPPKFIAEALLKVAKDPEPMLHQYTRAFGHLRLVNALCQLYSKLVGREIDPLNEILVTYGGYEALFCAIIGIVGDGDEVIVIEPFFDSYAPVVKAAGGIAKYIPLRLNHTGHDPPTSKDWILDQKELQGLFNVKTKVIIVNTPQNPVGKVFTEQELLFIADLCKKWDVLCLADEVYEWQVYQPNKHVRMAALPGMWDRTITVGSIGKSFSVTGWKIGWAYCSAKLMVNLQMVHQNCVYTGCTPIQEAAAICFERELAFLGKDVSYLTSISEELRPKRDFLVKTLTEVGMKPTIPDGCYFVVADWSPLEAKVDLQTETDKHKDYRFTKWMTKNLGLQGIPPTAFYCKEHRSLYDTYVRYCFFKKDATLKKAADILHQWKEKMQ